MIAETAEPNVFDELNAQPVPGLEYLGRAIVDERGMPSGSPANYEKLRGQDGLTPVDVPGEVNKLMTDPALLLPNLA